MHTGSNATHQVTIGQGTPVLDHHTGRLWLFMTRNNSELLITWSDDHGASFAPVKDIQSVKPRGYGWIAPSFSGTQLKSGRLVQEKPPTLGGPLCRLLLRLLLLLRHRPRPLKSGR